jgi:hypothetical protein
VTADGQGKQKISDPMAGQVRKRRLFDGMSNACHFEQRLRASSHMGLESKLMFKFLLEGRLQ